MTIRLPDHWVWDAWYAVDGGLVFGFQALAAAGVTGTVYYGYRAWGPNWPYDPAWTPGSARGFVADFDEAGNRFNPNKLLFDPYARELSHDPVTPSSRDGAVYNTGPAARARDSAPSAPKGIVLASDAADAAGAKGEGMFAGAAVPGPEGDGAEDGAAGDGADGDDAEGAGPALGTADGAGAVGAAAALVGARTVAPRASAPNAVDRARVLKAE